MNKNKIAKIILNIVYAILVFLVLTYINSKSFIFFLGVLLGGFYSIIFDWIDTTYGRND